MRETHGQCRTRNNDRDACVLLLTVLGDHHVPHMPQVKGPICEIKLSQPGLGMHAHRVMYTQSDVNHTHSTAHPGVIPKLLLTHHLHDISLYIHIY